LVITDTGDFHRPRAGRLVGCALMLQRGGGAPEWRRRFGLGKPRILAARPVHAATLDVSDPESAITCTR